MIAQIERERAHTSQQLPAAFFSWGQALAAARAGRRRSPQPRCGRPLTDGAPPSSTTSADRFAIRDCTAPGGRP